MEAPIGPRSCAGLGYAGNMHTGQTTRGTLLGRIRDGTDEVAAWRELDSTYREMLLRFCRSRGLQHADAEDVVQQVFARLVNGLKKFEYDRSRGRFRDYVYRCVRNAISDWVGCQSRTVAGVVGLCGVVKEEQEWVDSFHQEWVDHHFRCAIAEVEKTADPQSIEVLRATLAGRTVKEVAVTLGMQEMAVYKVQQRMRDRLRARIAEQVAEEDSE